MQALIPCYADADDLAAALDTIPDAWDVHVVDGREADFPQIGGVDYTPDAEAVCADHENVTYHRPPSDLLPFGHDADHPDEYRYPQYCHAQYQLSCIDETRWTLKLDADERLVRFNVQVGRGARDTDGLNPALRYMVDVQGHYQDGAFYPPRLYVPERWTFWTDDGFVPREIVSRDAPLAVLHAEFHAGAWKYRQAGSERHNVVIANAHDERDADYRAARDRQFRGIIGIDAPTD